MLRGKRVLLGISAGIAAYKTPLIIRELIKEGAEVQVVMTPTSADFVTPLTLSTVSKKPVYHQYYDGETGEWNNHVELAKWADIFLIAPATTNTLAKMASGLCDNLLLACYFSMPDPKNVFFAPAMDLDMYQHEQNQSNIKKLQSFGNHLIDAEYGELASGLEGKGRMADIPKIIKSLMGEMSSQWVGKNVVITAGPTFEEIDPVRYIGNYSSGKMGYALANVFSQAGANVYLVSGPTHLESPRAVELRRIVSAQQMFEEVTALQTEADVIIMAAAVADYRPAQRAELKIKKSAESLQISLEPNPDILAYLGEHKMKGQLIVGFALETNNAIENAREKLSRKKVDLIVVNSMEDEGAGFGHDTNKVTLIDKNNKEWTSELKSKAELAKDILKQIEGLL